MCPQARRLPLQSPLYCKYVFPPEIADFSRRSWTAERLLAAEAQPIIPKLRMGVGGRVSAPNQPPYAPCGIIGVLMPVAVYRHCRRSEGSLFHAHRRRMDAGRLEGKVNTLGDGI